MECLLRQLHHLNRHQILLRLKPVAAAAEAAQLAEAESPELQRELALDQELLRLQGLRNQAELESNQRELIRLDTQMKLAELAKQEGDIRASDVPDQEGFATSAESSCRSQGRTGRSATARLARARPT